MNKELFATAAELIKSTGTIKSVRLWNAEIWEKTDIMDIFPVVFIDFSELRYDNIGALVQECNGQMTVHILYKTIHPEDTAIMDLAQEVYTLLQRGGFVRVSERPEYSNQEIIDWQLVFEIPRFEDYDAEAIKVYVKKADVALNLSNNEA